jgi:RNA-binding protein
MAPNACSESRIFRDSAEGNQNSMVATKKPLSSAAIRHLRGIGHALDPVIAIGKAGITAAFVAETKRALLKHELVKVRVQSEAPVDRKEAAAEVATETGAELVQVLGRTFLLYRRNPEKPKITIPKPKTKAEIAKAAKVAKAAAKASKKTAAGPKRTTTAVAVIDDDDDDANVTDETDDSEGDLQA